MNRIKAALGSLVLLAVAGLYFQSPFTGAGRDDDERRIIMTIITEGQSGVEIWYSENEVPHGPYHPGSNERWDKTIKVAPGTDVRLSARQDGAGHMTCFLQNFGSTVFADSDSNDKKPDRSEVNCRTRA